MRYLYLMCLGALILLVETNASYAVIRAGMRRSAAAIGPYGAATAHSARGVAAGPLGGVRSGAAQTGSMTTRGGTTVQYGSAAAARSGPFGRTEAGRASGVRVTTPAGQTYSRGSSTRVNAGPFGASGVHRSRSSTIGPYGAAASRRTAVGIRR